MKWNSTCGAIFTSAPTKRRRQSYCRCFSAGFCCGSEDWNHWQDTLQLLRIFCCHCFRIWEELTGTFSYLFDFKIFCFQILYQQNSDGNNRNWYKFHFRMLNTIGAERYLYEHFNRSPWEEGIETLLRADRIIWCMKKYNLLLQNILKFTKSLPLIRSSRSSKMRFSLYLNPFAFLLVPRV